MFIFLHEASYPHSSAGKKNYVETYQSSTHTRTQVRVKNFFGILLHPFLSIKIYDEEEKYYFPHQSVVEHVPGGYS